MAVVFEGFSIREYVSKMRSVNVAKCWPFDEKDKESKKEEIIESLLPPITCRKYRWWSDEVEILKSKSTLVNEEEKTKINIREEVNERESGFELSSLGNLPIDEQEAVLMREKVDEAAEKVVMVCPVCQIFRASTVNAVNVHIDSCLAKASKKEKKKMRKAAAEAAKAKSKTTRKKKRSIVEIFAVAPQIENLEVLEEEDDEEQEEEEEEVFPNHGFIKTKKLKGIKKSKSKVDVTLIMRNLKLKNERKKKKKRKMIDHRSPVAPSSASYSNKEKNHKQKLPLPTAFLPPCKGPLFKKSEREISDDFATRKKKPSKKKSLPTQNKLITIQGSKLISKHQQCKLPVFPVHSILKNQSRAISRQKSSAESNLQGCVHTNLRSIQQSDRHVRFSGKDDILGPTEKQFSSFELPQIQTHHQVLSEVIDNALVTDLSVEHDENPVTYETPEVNGSDEDVISIASAAGFRSTQEKTWLDDLNGNVSPPPFLIPNNSSCRDERKGFSDESSDKTQAFRHHGDSHLFTRDNSSALYNLAPAGMPRFYNSTQGASDTGRSLYDPFVDSVQRSAAMSSLPNIRATSQPSASSVTSNTEIDGRQRFLSQTIRYSSNSGAVEYQPLSHLSTKDLMNCISSSVEWKNQRGAIFGGKYVDEDFIGLPLNSQGELIQFNSSGKVGYSHLKKQDMMVGSSSSFPTHNLIGPNKEKQYVEKAFPRDHLKLFPKNNGSGDNPKVPTSSRLAMTEMQGVGRTEVQWRNSLKGSSESVHQLSSDLNLMNVSGYGCKQCRLTPKQSESEWIQPEESSECVFLPPNQTTMRLMGKDVTVGRTNKEGRGFEDGHIWTDKEIITEHRPSLMLSDDVSFYRHPQPEWNVHQVSQKSKEVANHSWKEAQATSPEFLQMKAVEPRSAHSYLDWQIPLESQTGIPLTSKNHSRELQSGNRLASNLFMNRTSKVPASDFSQNQSLNMGSRISLSSTTPSNACDHMLFHSAQFKSDQNMAAHGEPSSFFLPFSSKDCVGYSEPSWCRSSSQRLPQWLINAKQQKETPLTSSKPFPDASATCQSCTVSGPSMLAISSPYHNSMIPYPNNPKTNFHMQNSSVGTSLCRPPLIPAPPGFRCAFSINSCSKKRVKVKDGRNSKNSCFNDFDHVKKVKKRPAAEANDSARLMKKPNWQMQQESNAKLGLKGPADFSAYEKYKSGPSEPNAYNDKGNGTGYYSQVEIQKDGLRTSGSNFPKLDAVAKSGPIKLSAGAKHILKPNQNMAQDYSRPTHSTIPFGPVTNASKASVFQKKPAQIYRF